MKYQNLKSFEKHLQNASPSHFSRVYLVSIPDDSQRSLVLQTVVSALKVAKAALETFSPDDGVYRILDALQSPSLFGDETIALFDGCDAFKKKEIEPLLSWIAGPMQSGYLVLGARGKTPLLKEVEKAGIVFDLSEEKPWEKEKRLILFVEEKATEQKKRFEGNGAQVLVQQIGQDLMCLMQELEKLFSFVGDKSVIQLADIAAICSVYDEETPWKTAEEMVWEKEMGAFDAAEFQPLLFGIRAQLQIGMKVLSLQQEGVPLDLWSPYFPKVWPKTLEKRKHQALQKGPLFFEKGLETVFRIESMSRGGSTELSALFELLQISLLRYS